MFTYEYQRGLREKIEAPAPRKRYDAGGVGSTKGDVHV
nr:MAG TPA: hypothetical protein [Bacteriophage sp.]